MLRAPYSDFWQVGLSLHPQTNWLDHPNEVRADAQIHWMPDPGPWRYRADPFGLNHQGKVHVFVECYDYRTKHGIIEHVAWSPDAGWGVAQEALVKPYHLSYPQVFRHQGEIWMMPESHQAGEVALYRARNFPNDWVREKALLSGLPVAEASLLQQNDHWWMFFTLVGPQARDQRELHIAMAPTLWGPWQLHPANPIRVDKTSARPGGSPFINNRGFVSLPVQDCSQTYGGGLRFLEFQKLSLQEVACTVIGPTWRGADVSSLFTEGLHTLSGTEDWSLIDCKRISRSRERQWLDLQRRWRRLFP